MLCVPWSCNGSGDCPYGYTCDINGACVTTPEIDAGSGYCGQGCPSGYVCAIANGLAQCAPLGAIPVDDSGTYVGVLDASPIQSQDAWVMLDAPAGDDSALSTDSGSLADASSGDAGSFATDANLTDVIEASILEASTSEASTSEASTPEAGGGAEGGPLGGLCNADSQCANTGAKCIDGLCTAQSQLCTDGTQCLAAGEVCIDGVCLPTCSGRELPPGRLQGATTRSARSRPQPKRPAQAPRPAWAARSASKGTAQLHAPRQTPGPPARTARSA